MVEGGGLLNRYMVNSRIGGSNPPPSANFNGLRGFRDGPVGFEPQYLCHVLCRRGFISFPRPRRVWRPVADPASGIADRFPWSLSTRGRGRIGWRFLVLWNANDIKANLNRDRAFAEPYERASSGVKKGGRLCAGPLSSQKEER